MKRILLSIMMIVPMLFAFQLSAADYKASATQLANNKLKAIASDPDVIAAVKAQNAQNAALSQGDVKALDDKWRGNDTGFINGVLNNSLSQKLKKISDQSAGLYTEIFVMDNKGLNVGQSSKTSDYWQGDEAKWQDTYLVGPNAMHLSDVEEDESSQTFQMQISLPVVDGNQVIGAITVGVNAEQL